MRFILVDDEEPALHDLENILKETAPDSEIFSFTSPYMAVERSKKEKIDTAFLDVELGNYSGIALAKKLKDIQPDMHIIFVSAYSQYAIDAFSIHANGYLLKPADKDDVLKELTFLYGRSKDDYKKTRIQTFGGFEVFVDGKRIEFSRGKAKELLAYLVDRKGCGTTTRDACAILWEDSPYNNAQKNYFQTIVSDLRKTLKAAGIEDILKKSRNSLAIIPEKIDCDVYRFMKGDPEAVNSYRHNYMICYSWAEFSMGEIENNFNRN